MDIDIEKTNVVRREMERWGLYQPGDVVFVIRLNGESLSLGYRSGSILRVDGTYWDANVIEDTFYLLSIHLACTERGKGHGTALYEIIERIASQLGCGAIRQTPSGVTVTRESRMEYLHRRGWMSDGVEMFKQIGKPVMVGGW